MGNSELKDDRQTTTVVVNEVKQNDLAIAGFVLSFFITVVGLILSILGYRKSKRLNGNGKGLALAGIIISSVNTAVTIITLLAVYWATVNTGFGSIGNSRLFSQLGLEGFLNGVWETIYMTALSAVISYLIGLPLGVLLCITDRDGLKPIVWLNKIISIIVNILRSIPFIILMVALIPASRAIVGTSIGNNAMIFMLVIAAAPYVARMVESSIKEVDKGVVEAARSMGAGTFNIIWKVYLPEAKPSLIVGAVISTVTILGYSAMAGTIAGGGLGAIAVTKARPSNAQDVIWLCVALIVVIVQVIQEVGMYLAKKTDKRMRQNAKSLKKKSKN